MKHQLLMKSILVSVILGVFLIGCGSSNSDTTAVAEEKKILLGWYLTGSDLESGVESDEKGAGTSDLLEALKGYRSLSPEQQATVDIKVVFGGSNKDGWRGIKYADIDCLYQDSLDGEFGNDSCYMKEDPDANMGDPSTLQDFITYLNELGSYDKRMLNLWNHGGAYQGICLDENHEDMLTLNELKEVFEATRTTFDIIGMDACLMANYSVAKSVKDYATYLLASEELEPGHGWQYEDLVISMGTQKDKDIVTISKAIIDSFIDSPDHNTDDSIRKTLSLIDLRKVQTISDKFDTLNQSLTYGDMGVFKPTANAIFQSKRYDKDEDGFRVIDFQGYMEQLTLELPNSSSAIEPVKDAIEDSIIYSRYQEGMEGSTGITIANPFNDLFTDSEYSDIQSLSEIWRTTTREFTAIKEGDTEEPTIDNFEIDCVNDTEVGTCLDISDNTAISSFHYNIFADSGNDSYIKIAATDILEDIGDGRYFFVNNHFDSVPMLCSDEEGCSFLSLTYIDKGEYFSMEVYNNRLPYQLNIELDDDDNITDIAIVQQYEDGTSGRMEQLDDSDNIEYFLAVYNNDGTKRFEESIHVGPIKGSDIKKLFVIKNIQELGEDMSVKMNMEVEDINDNISYSPIF